MAVATARSSNDGDGAVPPQPRTACDGINHRVGRRVVADSYCVSPPRRSFGYNSSSFFNSLLGRDREPFQAHIGLDALREGHAAVLLLMRLEQRGHDPWKRQSGPVQRVHE